MMNHTSPYTGCSTLTSTYSMLSENLISIDEEETVVSEDKQFNDSISHELEDTQNVIEFGQTDSVIFGSDSTTDNKTDEESGNYEKREIDNNTHEMSYVHETDDQNNPSVYFSLTHVELFAHDVEDTNDAPATALSDTLQPMQTEEFPDKEKIEEESPGTYADEQLHQCEICWKCFAYACRLKSHLKKHSGEKLHQCDQCVKCFFTNNELKIHKNRHSTNKPYKCDQCVKCFVALGELKAHKQRHSGDKPYKCDQCVKCFVTCSELRVHKIQHSDDKPYKCDQCGKCFGTRDDLKMHEKKHTAHKTHQCDKCAKTFVRHDHLKRHKLIHSGKKPYQCDQCVKYYGTLNGLKTHKKRHAGHKPHKCDQCAKIFVENYELTRHKLIHTSDKPNQCKKSFSRNSILNKHRQRCHKYKQHNVDSTKK